jgi:hypothetical protein
MTIELENLIENIKQTWMQGGIKRVTSTGNNFNYETNLILCYRIVCYSVFPD